MNRPWDVQRVITERMNFDNDIGIAFEFSNGQRQAFIIKKGMSFDEFAAHVNLLQQWINIEKAQK